MGQANPVAVDAARHKPHAHRVEALRALIAQQGLDLKVACVVGDDLLDRKELFHAQGVTEMFSGAAFPEPEKVLSINAYLGAFPIAQALSQGADGCKA